MSGDTRKTTPLIGVIDAGTTTIKFSVFQSRENKEFIKASKEIETLVPEEGWYEQDPQEIIMLVRDCIKEAMSQLGSRKINFS